MPNRVQTMDHIGITVQNLDAAIAFWRDVLGFEVTDTWEMQGAFAENVTGVKGLHTKVAFVSSGAIKFELVEYLAPADRQSVRLRPCDLGAVHFALVVDDLDSILEGCRAHGVVPAGPPQTLDGDPSPGGRDIFVFTPDGITIELFEPGASA